MTDIVDSSGYCNVHKSYHCECYRPSKQPQMEETTMETTTRKRARYPAKFKADVAIQALIGATTIAEIATEHDIHPVTVSTWKKEAIDRLHEIFAKAEDPAPGCDCDEQLGALYKKIGQLTIEMEQVKKA